MLFKAIYIIFLYTRLLKEKMNKKCLECGSELVRVEVSVDDADSRAVSWQCESYGHFEFEEESSNKVVNELKSKQGSSNMEIKQERNN